MGGAVQTEGVWSGGADSFLEHVCAEYVKRLFPLKRHMRPRAIKCFEITAEEVEK